MYLRNPAWPPHAKFHDAQYIGMGVLIGAIGLVVLWQRTGHLRNQFFLAAAPDRSLGWPCSALPRHRRAGSRAHGRCDQGHRRGSAAGHRLADAHRVGDRDRGRTHPRTDPGLTYDRPADREIDDRPEHP
ncbi:hypothetical protein ACQP0C_36620 [Nocardia sp. CA-129566]|uniref:hypothetical protein n=1 Tax=Nocardia sp. CA-129566 TaxID=3239976 RepID=UPI003D97B696